MIVLIPQIVLPLSSAHDARREFSLGGGKHYLWENHVKVGQIAHMAALAVSCPGQMVSPTPDSPALHPTSGSEATIRVFRTRRLFHYGYRYFSPT